MTSPANPLVGRPQRSHRLAFGFVGGLIGIVGVAALLKGNPLGAVLVALGLYGVSDCWRRVTVSETRLVAQGRITRRRAELSSLSRIGVSRMANVWVAPNDGRAFYLRMVGEQNDGSNPGVWDFVARLRERAAAAGAILESEDDEMTSPPRGTSPWFGA